MQRVGIIVGALTAIAVGQLAAAQPAGQQRATLNLVTAGDQNMVDYVKDYLGPMFEKEHPGVTVRAVGTGPGDAGSQKIYEKLEAEKNTSSWDIDVAIIHQKAAGEMVGKGLLARYTAEVPTAKLVTSEAANNVSGSAVCDGGCVIDLSPMHAVHVDQTARTVRVEGGATLADIDRETQRFGLATTTGNVSKTGIAGLTLSGGFGNLRRKFGLGVDNLLSAEVVTADGAVVRTDASTNPDLFLGRARRGRQLRGRDLFRVPTPPAWARGDVSRLSSLALGRRGKPFVSGGDCMSDARDEISSIAFFWTVPQADPFPEELRGGRVFLYGALYAGPGEEGEKALAPVMKIGTPILDLSGRGPYTQWQQAFDPFFIPGSVYPRLYAYWKSLYLHGLDDPLIDDLVGRARELPSEQCLIAIWQLGGALARVPREYPGGSSSSWHDILIHTKQVPRIVDLLDLSQALVI